MNEKKSDSRANGADESPVSEPIIIKKYANRRLYNTTLSSYITLDDLAAMVRRGQDFVVQDAKTAEDLTRSVLTQIIFEQEARGGPLLPVGFLRQLIRMYGDALQGYVPSYLEMTMASFERNHAAIRSQMQRSFGSAPGYSQLEAMAQANMEMFRKAMGMAQSVPGMAVMLSPFNGHQPTTDAAKTESNQEMRDLEIAELRRQLAEMQERVENMAGA
jgi:polyhydroxyalkanoate synthesis repressor PhaR